MDNFYEILAAGPYPLFLKITIIGLLWKKGKSLSAAQREIGLKWCGLMERVDS